VVAEDVYLSPVQGENGFGAGSDAQLAALAVFRGDVEWPERQRLPEAGHGNW
jgi:hypothetical protein